MDIIGFDHMTKVYITSQWVIKKISYDLNKHINQKLLYNDTLKYQCKALLSFWTYSLWNLWEAVNTNKWPATYDVNYVY